MGNPVVPELVQVKAACEAHSVAALSGSNKYADVEASLREYAQKQKLHHTFSISSYFLGAYYLTLGKPLFKCSKLI